MQNAKTHSMINTCKNNNRNDYNNNELSNENNAKNYANHHNIYSKKTKNGPLKYRMSILVHSLLLHLTCCTQVRVIHTQPTVAAGDVNLIVDVKPSANFASDNYNIRHGRSRVRHSSEHWNLQAFNDNNNLTHGGNDGEAEVSSYGYRKGNLDADGLVADNIVNGTKYGREYGPNLDDNETSVRKEEQRSLPASSGPRTLNPSNVPIPPFARIASDGPQASSTAVDGTAVATTTRAPVTHKIRKLHKKKIMESIRRSVEERGLKLSKNHRSLAEAEHLQGRPSTQYETRGAEVLKEVRHNKETPRDKEEDDEDVDGRENGELTEDYDYQNDDYGSTVASLGAIDGYNFESHEEDAGEQKLKASSTDEGRKATTITEATHMESMRTAYDNASQIGHNLSNNSIYNNNSTDNNGNNKYRDGLPSDQRHKQPQADDWSSEPNQPQVQNLFSAASLKTERVAAGRSEEYSFTATNKELAANDDPELLTTVNESYAGNQTESSETTTEPTIKRGRHGESSSASFSSEVNINADSSSLNEAASRSLAEPQSLIIDTGIDNKTISDTFPDTQSGIRDIESNLDDGMTLDRALELEANDDEDTNYTDDSVNSGEEFEDVVTGSLGGSDDDMDGTNHFLEGVVDAANEDEIYDWDEISRNNRRNLMRGRDVVTKFLQIVETQHSLGANCEAGTSLNLGEGVVDRYAQDRFRVEAEVAVNRANMLTRIFKMTSPAVQASINLLHASVLSMVEFDDDIFAAGNCFDWNQHSSQPGLFCPFAYRLPPPQLGAILAKDLATEYHYLGNTSEWFFQARRNAEKVIARNEQYLRAFHLYSNKTEERIEEVTLAVKYEDGRWSKPYYDCGGGNIWMLTYTVPFFGYENGSYFFKGTSGIDIDLRRVDIDQCPQRNSPGTVQPLNIFAGTDKCKQRTTMCEAIKGLGFRRGSYKCVCRKGYYFPDTASSQKFFNGSLLEEEYEKLMLGTNSTYNAVAAYECLPCAEGCDSCEDDSPCIAALNWPMRTSILVLACAVIGLLPPAAWFTFRYQQVKVVRAASPALLRMIALGAFLIYCTTIVMYPNPSVYTCTARIWLREIGFSLTYGALMLKTWRISVIFRVRSAKAVKITDATLLKRLGIICGAIGTCLLVRTLVSPPDVVVGRTADDLKAFLCKTDWWDYTFTSMEVLFLAWGVRLCIMVRKAPSEFNESRFISMAIYNEFLLTCFLNVSMLFLQSPANPDLLYIIFFCHIQLTITLLLALIFGSKVYIVLRSGRSHQESVGLAAKASATKFNFRPQVRTFVNPSTATTSSAQMGGGTATETRLSDQEALEEIRQLSVQLQRIQEMAPPKGVAVMTISSLLDGLRTPGSLMMVAAAAGSAGANQLAPKKQQHQLPSSLPLLALSSDFNSYSSGSNTTAGATDCHRSRAATTTSIGGSAREKAVNTSLTGDDFPDALLKASQAHLICSRCLQSGQELYSGGGGCVASRPSTPTLCQRLGSPPQPEGGSISFSNIKLECMCSQPDDLDRRHTSGSAASASLISRRLHKRTAATNTPPSAHYRRSSSSSKVKGSSVQPPRDSSMQPSRDSSVQPSRDSSVQPSRDSSANNALETPKIDRSDTFRICDNCKTKLRDRSRSRCSGKSQTKISTNFKALKFNTTKTRPRAKNAASTSAAGGVSISQTRSNELLDRLTTASSRREVKKIHSTDDIAFYTDDDDDKDDDDGDDHYHHHHHHSDTDDDEESSSSGSSRSSSRDDNDCSTLRNRRPQQTLELRDELGNSFALACLADFAAASTSSSTVTGSSAAAASETRRVEESALQSSSIPSTTTVVSTANDKMTSHSNGRPKRPDKLTLDLNDRSKYTKEVSV